MLEGWAGDVYGIPVQSTLDAIRLTGQLEDAVEVPGEERLNGPPHNGLRHQRNSPAYALSAGWPPRWA